MHRDDEMTSNERLNAFFEGREVDHLPAMPFLDSIGCNAPIENIDYFMAAVRNCAKYPLDPLKW